VSKESEKEGRTKEREMGKRIKQEDMDDESRRKTLLEYSRDWE